MTGAITSIRAHEQQQVAVSISGLRWTGWRPHDSILTDGLGCTNPIEQQDLILQQ